MEKRYCLLLLGLFILHSFVFAQNGKDSLRNIIKSQKTSTTQKMDAYVQLTNELAGQNDPDFKKTADLGIKYAAKINDSVQMAFIIKNKAKYYKSQEKRDSALLYFYESSALFERQNHPLEAAEIYNEIARIYRRDEVDRALHFYDKAYAIYDKANDEKGLAIILNESGMAYQNKGDLDEAIRRYSSSLEIQKRRNDSVGIGYALEFLSGAYLIKKEFRKSKDYLLESLKIRTELKDTFALAINYTNLGEFYQTTNDPHQAISNVLLSNKLARKIDFLDLLSHNYNLLSNLYQQTGEYKLAYESMNQHYAIKDSLFDLQKSKQIEEISVKYETEKNKSLIKEQNLKILKRNYAIGISIFLLLALIGIAFLLFKRTKLKNDLKLKQSIIKEQEASTKAVMNAEEEERQRIARDLHDGVGQLMSTAKMNLSSLESYIDFKDENQKRTFENAIHLVDESCKEVRVVSHNLMPNALLKKSLADAIRNFIHKIEKDKLKVHLYMEGFEEKLDQNLESVLYRIVQECVNNVIKHADASSLDISILKDAHEINLTIEDNGKGFLVDKISSFDGMGLKNITSRVLYLKGTVDFDSEPGKGTLVAINIPLKKNHEDA